MRVKHSAIAQMNSLAIGDRVMWNDDPNDLGSVIDVGYCAVTITWDNGQTGTIAIADINGKVKKAETKENRK